MTDHADWRPASESVCREAYRHLLVHNMALYGLLPPLHDFTDFVQNNEASSIVASVKNWRWFIAAWTHPGRPPSHRFELFVWPHRGEEGLTIARGQFVAALVPVPLVRQLP